MRQKINTISQKKKQIINFRKFVEPKELQMVNSLDTSFFLAENRGRMLKERIRKEMW